MERLAQMEKENESLRARLRLMEAGQTQNLTLLVGEHFEQGCTPERLKGKFLIATATILPILTPKVNIDIV